MSNKAIFLDRDGTLIEDPGYINNPDQVKLLEGVPDALDSLRSMGYKLVVVSNQSAVARGIVTEEVLAQIHKRLEQLLAQEGASLDGIYYCPYHPDGVIPKYRRDSDHRKPNPGMLLDAGKDMDIDLAESWMVGNSPGDIEAGSRAGCKTILLDSRGRVRLEPGRPVPDYRAINLKEVVNIVKMHARSAQKQQTTAQPISRQIEEPQEQPESPQQAATPQQNESQQTVSQPLESEPKAELQNGEHSTKNKTEELLTAILEQLKGVRRSGMYSGSDFSFLRFMAGMALVTAVFCLLISIWFLLGPDKQTDRLLIALGFAAVLQLMALTLYTMQGPK